MVALPPQHLRLGGSHGPGTGPIHGGVPRTPRSRRGSSRPGSGRWTITRRGKEKITRLPGVRGEALREDAEPVRGAGPETGGPRADVPGNWGPHRDRCPALGSNTPLGRSPLLIWAVISFALSVLVAIWSRGPTIYGTPLEIRDLLKVMDDHPELTKNKTGAVLASSYHVAVVGTYATNEWKAGQLWRATTLLLAGIVFLVAMLITADQSSHSPLGGRIPEGGNPPGADAGATNSFW